MFAVEEYKGYQVVKLSGDITPSDSENLRKTIFDLIECQNPPYLVVDLSDIKILPSATLGTLVSGHRRISEANGKIILCSLHQNLRKMLEITRLIMVLDCVNTPDEAVSKLRSI